MNLLPVLLALLVVLEIVCARQRFHEMMGNNELDTDMGEMRAMDMDREMGRNMGRRPMDMRRMRGMNREEMVEERGDDGWQDRRRSGGDGMRRGWEGERRGMDSAMAEELDDRRRAWAFREDNETAPVSGSSKVSAKGAKAVKNEAKSAKSSASGAGSSSSSSSSDSLPSDVKCTPTTECTVDKDCGSGGKCSGPTTPAALGTFATSWLFPQLGTCDCSKTIMKQNCGNKDTALLHTAKEDKECGGFDACNSDTKQCDFDAQAKKLNFKNWSDMKSQHCSKTKCTVSNAKEVCGGGPCKTGLCICGPAAPGK